MPQLRLVLDDAGLAQVIPAIAKASAASPDIAIDPIRNVRRRRAGGENDNGAMLFFSRSGGADCQAVNPDAG